jgi:hypothetical protein
LEPFGGGRKPKKFQFYKKFTIGIGYNPFFFVKKGIFSENGKREAFGERFCCKSLILKYLREIL